MSNYLGKANNPNTGNLEDCEFLDDFYGKRQYAVRFKDGTTYPESEVEGLPMNELKPELWEEEFEKYMHKHKCFDSNAIELAQSFLEQALLDVRRETIEEVRGLVKGTREANEALIARGLINICRENAEEISARFKAMQERYPEFCLNVFYDSDMDYMFIKTTEYGRIKPT